MKSIRLHSAHEAPSILLQADRVRRRIAASDAVAAMIAELAFGPPRRGDVAMLAAVTAVRIGGECR